MNFGPNFIFAVFDSSGLAKMWIFGWISYLPFLTGPDLQKWEFLANCNFWHFRQVRTCKNVNFWLNLIFDIFDGSRPAKMWNFGQISFLPFLTGPDLQKCEFLAKFNFWHFQQVRSCKNVNFWPNLIFDIFDRSGPAKCEFIANFHFWHFDRSGAAKMWILGQI